MARSCLAFATFLDSDPEGKIDPVRVHEVQRLRGRADEILTRISSPGPTDAAPMAEPTELQGESTDPGVTHA